MGRVRRFFLGNLTEKLVALALALLVYGFVFGQSPVEQTVRVPIQLENLPPKFIVSKLAVHNVDLRLSAPKTLLVGLEERNLRANIDLSKSATGFQTYLFSQKNFSVPRGIKLDSISPPEISFFVDELTSKVVPVAPNFTNRLPEGYELESAEVTPKEIEIYGAKQEVSQTDEIPTQPIDLSTLREDAQLSVNPELISPDVKMSFGGRVQVSLRIRKN
ncbi:MAG: YbbR-like domain-containing protein [Nitrospirae bacterium]|nr:YbbR-like domain-containing protein [Nitrospirota bacterium]